MIRLVFRKFSRFCQGCGAAFQHLDTGVEGYIPENRYKNTLIHNIKAEEQLKEAKSENISFKDFKPTRSEREAKKPVFEEIDDIEEIEERVKSATPLEDYQDKLKIKPLVCMRCFKLSKYGQFTEVKSNLSNQLPQTTLNEISDLVKFDSIILNVVDLIDFNGSLIREIFDLALQKKSHLVLILNKIDALPLDAKTERIYRWGIDQTRGAFKNLDVVTLSARTGEGYDKVIRILKELHESLPSSKVFVVGATNSGKSSFINTLARKCWNLPAEKFKRPDLTTSAFAGTTLSPVEVSLKSLGLKIIDTPGIPTVSQITTLLSLADSKLIIPNKRIKPVVLTATPNFVFWIGGLVRIDMISGDFKYLTFFVSHMCTIHKTFKEKADDLFKRQTGKLLKPAYDKNVEWDVHRVLIDCKSKKAEKDLVVHGLGWVSVTGNGKCEFEVRVGKGVGFTVRDPLMPHEAKPDLVQFTKGKTINSEKYRKFGRNIKKG